MNKLYLVILNMFYKIFLLNRIYKYKFMIAEIQNIHVRIVESTWEAALIMRKMRKIQHK